MDVITDKQMRERFPGLEKRHATLVFAEGMFVREGAGWRLLSSAPATIPGAGRSLHGTGVEPPEGFGSPAAPSLEAL